MLRLLRKLGKLDDLDAEEPDALLQIHVAATQGKTALGAAAGKSDVRPGRGSLQVQFRHGEGSLCADLDGFSLHAAVCVPAGRRDQLEHLIRYVARSPIVEELLSGLQDGRVAYGVQEALARWLDRHGPRSADLPRAARCAGPATTQEARQLLRRIRLCCFVPPPRRAAAASFEARGSFRGTKLVAESPDSVREEQV